MPVKIEKNAVLVAPEAQIDRLLNDNQVEIGRGAIVIATQEDWTAEGVAALLTASVAASTAGPQA